MGGFGVFNDTEIGLLTQYRNDFWTDNYDGIFQSVQAVYIISDKLKSVILTVKSAFCFAVSPWFTIYQHS